MDALLVTDSRQLALDLYGLLRELDPGTWRDELEVSVRRRFEALRDALGHALTRAWPTDGFAAVIRLRVSELHAAVVGAAPHGRAEWMALRAQLQPRYDALALSLRAWDIHVPSLRPTNYARNAFHLAWALFALALAHAVDRGTLSWLALGATAMGWSFELSRRLSPAVNRLMMAAFAPFAHPHEAHRVNSATWYTSATLVLSLAAPTDAGTVALAVLGTGDPIAAIVGRRYGRTRLVNGRSLEGTSAFVLVSGLAAWAALAVWHPELSAGVALAGAAAGALAGAVAELLVRRIDDNLAIPLSAAAAAALVLGALR